MNRFCVILALLISVSPDAQSKQNLSSPGNGCASQVRRENFADARAFYGGNMKRNWLFERQDQGCSYKIFVKEYKAWKRMRLRCFSKTDKYYHYYGGRGITVCEKWKISFSDFLKDMGRAPTPKHSIDRINNDGNYEPSNCRWATHQQQVENTRHCNFITYKGATKTLTNWAKHFGVCRTTFSSWYVIKGFSMEQCVAASARLNKGAV